MQQTNEHGLNQSFGHGGNSHAWQRINKQKLHELVDFSANINPLGLPFWTRTLVNRQLENIVRYPDPDYTELKEAIAEKYHCDRNCIVPANGSSELLYLLPGILNIKRIVIPVPAYIDYLRSFQAYPTEVVHIVLSETNNFILDEVMLARVICPGDGIILGNPSNPTGTYLSDAQLISWAKRFPECVFIIDEAFKEFVTPCSSIGARLPNIISLNSLTKFFSAPGLRIGFGLLPEPILGALKKRMPEWNVNSLGQAFAIKALHDDAYGERSRTYCRELRTALQKKLQMFDELKIFTGTANYIFIKLLAKHTDQSLYDFLLTKNIMIRRCSNYQGLDHAYIRVAVRTDKENELLIRALEAAFQNTIRATKRHRTGDSPARSIMFQGVSSNAGKSLMTAGVCRIMKQDGYRVVPFKAQNMSLNSFVTQDGKEMGRAQVVQARAAGLEPDCLMNPVLLKPHAETGSQVIVNGVSVGNMTISQYHEFKEQAFGHAKTAFDQLAQQYECIVLEGAGSPGEVNLRSYDFVNMPMAAYADAPVLLVGDIDRGGVYAALAGTMDVLSEAERKRISGFVINKFRGSQYLLEDAHRFLADHSGKKVIGVVPFLDNLMLPQEDSVVLQEAFYQNRPNRSHEIDIAVISLPHIANFTDLDALYFEDGVNVRLIKDCNDLGTPAAVILPGSKNVAADLDYINNKKFAHEITRRAAHGCTVIGICGGYQMLGKQLSDPHGIESGVTDAPGLGLLDIKTTLNKHKMLQRKTGRHTISGLPVEGYEIHHGLSEGGSADQAVIRFADGSWCGCQNQHGNVWGCYLHGLFDKDEFRQWFINDLRVKANLPPINIKNKASAIDQSLDRLADTLRSHCDIGHLYQAMKLG